jgi:hypothetical protein
LQDWVFPTTIAIATYAFYGGHLSYRYTIWISGNSMNMHSSRAFSHEIKARQ